MQKGLISEPDLERQGGVDLVDHRLALPEHIIESILANARKADEDERLVVLDSWDAFAKMLDPIDRLKTEQSMLAISEANGIRYLARQ